MGCPSKTPMGFLSEVPVGCPSEVPVEYLSEVPVAEVPVSV